MNLDDPESREMVWCNRKYRREKSLSNRPNYLDTLTNSNIHVSTYLLLVVKSLYIYPKPSRCSPTEAIVTVFVPWPPTFRMHSNTFFYLPIYHKSGGWVSHICLIETMPRPSSYLYHNHHYNHPWVGEATFHLVWFPLWIHFVFSFL